MKRIHSATSHFAIVMSVLAAASAGCTGSPPPFGMDGAPPVDASADMGLDRADSPGSVAPWLVLDPSDLIIDAPGLAVPSPVTYTATLMFPDGGMAAGAVVFSTDNPRVGAIDPQSGVLVFTGNGGLAHIRAALVGASPPVEVQTSLTVQVHAVVLLTNVPANAPALFAGAEGLPPSAALRFDYPADQVMMPRDVAPPDVQWTDLTSGSQQAATVYRLRLQRPHAVFDFYTIGGDHDVPDIDVWRRAVESDLESPLLLTLASSNQGHLATSAPLTVRTVDSIAAGAVTYQEQTWLVTTPPPSGVEFFDATVRRIDSEAATGVDIFPANGAFYRVDVVSTSRDGTHVCAAQSLAAGAPGSCYLFDVSVIPPVRLRQIPCGYFSPDGTQLLAPTTNSVAIDVVDIATGATLQTVNWTTLPQLDWAPDGSGVAGLLINDPAVEYRIGVAPVSTPDVFGAPVAVDTDTRAFPLQRDQLPAWSPDSRTIVFQTNESWLANRARPSGWTNSLFLVDGHGGHGRQLNRATNGSVNDFAPNFAPFNSGGVQWIVFSSTRPYGHTIPTGTSANLWVAAIHTPWDGVSDPSEVAYWLPGQQTRTVNTNAHWRPTPCLMTAAPCASDTQCCSGACIPDATGAGHCGAQTTVCRVRGQTCSSDGDCCAHAGLICTAAHTCDLPPPG